MTYTGTFLSDLMETVERRQPLGNCCLCGESIEKNGRGTMYQKAGVCLLCQDSYADVEEL